MNDLHVSATRVAAVLLWTIGIALAGVNVTVDIDLGALGVIAACGGAVLNVRGYFCRLEDRERNAFELGRDYEDHRRMRPV